MSQWDKLIKRLYTIPDDMRFEELKKILIRYGYMDNNPRGGSSHHSRFLHIYPSRKSMSVW